MRLLIWDIFMFLYRHKLKILAVTVLCFALSCFYVDYVQTYSAEVVIRYKDSCVANGKALDGSTFDPNEIVSPKVIVNANRDLPFNIKTYAPTPPSSPWPLQTRSPSSRQS